MTAPTVSSSSQAFWSKSMASAGHAVTHDLQSEHTAQSRQRSASARTSSSLKPRRTSSQVVRRATPSRVFMMRRACGSSGSSSVCGILTLSASLSHTGTSCSPRRKLWMARAPRRPAAIASIAVQGPIAAASPPANTPVRPVIIVSVSTWIWPRSTATSSAPARKSSTIAWPTAKITVSASSSTNSPSTGDRRAPAALVGLAQRAALEPHAGGDAALAEDLDGHERVLDVDLLLLALLDLLGRGRRRALVLDAGEGDLVGAAAEGGAAGVVGHVAAADHDHALAGGRRLAERLRAQELDGAHDALLVEAVDRQVLALVQAGRQEDGLVAVGEQRVDGEVRAAALPGLELDAEGGDAVDLALQRGARQAVLGDADAQHAAGDRQSLEHGRLVAELRELAGGGEACGAAADDRRPARRRTPAAARAAPPARRGRRRSA